MSSVFGKHTAEYLNKPTTTREVHLSIIKAFVTYNFFFLVCMYVFIFNLHKNEEIYMYIYTYYI